MNVVGSDRGRGVDAVSGARSDPADAVALRGCVMFVRGFLARSSAPAAPPIQALRGPCERISTLLYYRTRNHLSFFPCASQRLPRGTACFRCRAATDSRISCSNHLALSA